MLRLFPPTLFAATLIAGPAVASSILVLEAEDKTAPSIEVIEGTTDSQTTSAVPERQERGSDPDVFRAGEKGKPIRRVGPAPSPLADAPTSVPAAAPVSRVE